MLNLKNFYGITLQSLDEIEQATHKYITHKEIKQKILRQIQALRSVISKAK